jgi:hypothetical protein
MALEIPTHGSPETWKQSYNLPIHLLHTKLQKFLCCLEKAELFGEALKARVLYADHQEEPL